MATILLLVFGLYYINATAFNHLHIINGTPYVHSHCHMPHHHDSGDGGHSLIEINLFTQLGQLLMTAAKFVVGPTALYYLIETIGEQQSCKLLTCSPAGLNLRAPPMIVDAILCH